MHFSLTVCQHSIFWVIASPYFLQTMQHDLAMVDKKRQLMMLSQGSYEVYPEDKVIFRVHISKIRII